MWLYTYVLSSGLGPYWILLVTLVRVAKWNFHTPLYVHMHTHTRVYLYDASYMYIAGCPEVQGHSLIDQQAPLAAL